MALKITDYIPAIVEAMGKIKKKHLNKIHGNPLRIAIDHLQK